MFSLLIGMAVSTAVPAASQASGDVDRYIVSSERCAMWRDSLKEGASTPANQSAMQEACDPLPQRLSELRKLYADDPAIQRLSSYDGKTGRPTAPLPADVTALLNRLDQCSFLGGEVGGDGSDNDKSTMQKQDQLRCGDPLHADLQKLRQHYRQDVRISWRLSRYDGDDAPMPLLPEDLEAFEATSLACIKPGQHAANCANLPGTFAKLKIKYAKSSTLVEEFSAYCVWDEQHCYDPTSGHPVQVSYRSDEHTGKPLTDPATGKALIDVSPRDADEQRE